MCHTAKSLERGQARAVWGYPTPDGCGVSDTLAAAVATYAIGDIQGCFASFRALLVRFDFNPSVDRLWLVGDLVNRGPDSLGVLRWVRDHDTSIVSVLGNHDLHLIACAAGAAEPKAADTFQDVLDAPDAPELVEWLRTRPFVHRERGRVLVHGGFHPLWSIESAVALARDAEKALQSCDSGSFADRARRPKTARWAASVEAMPHAERAVAAAAIMVRVRCVDEAGGLPNHNGPPGTAPAGCVPWFHRFDPEGEEIVFGHWSALGHHVHGLFRCIDSGCVWGRALTAYRLDDGAVFHQPAVEEDV